MSIYIPGMEMPKGFTDVRIYADGRVVSRILLSFGEEIATAIPVPSHGRLIDADALAEEDNRQYNEYRKDNGLDDTCHRAIQWMLSSAPTIIEAEEAVQDARDGP